MGILNKSQESQRRVGRGDIDRQIIALEKHLEELKTIQKGLYSNNILSAVLDNISYSGENAEDLLYGITFDPAKGYDETSEYSQLARVYSDINRTKASKGSIVVYRSTKGEKTEFTQEYVYVSEDEQYSKNFGNITKKLSINLSGKK